MPGLQDVSELQRLKEFAIAHFYSTVLINVNLVGTPTLHLALNNPCSIPFLGVGVLQPDRLAGKKLAWGLQP